MNRFCAFVAAACFLQGTLEALDIQKEMEDFYNSFGSSVNTTSPDVYKGQKAGYATGGSIVMRNRVTNLKPATINLPRASGGCGGIDIYAGGFSFINSDQLINNLKSIAASSSGYAFMLSLECFSPQMANQIRTLQGWANQVNAIGINSCETAAGLVGSVWPQSERASEYICNTIGTNEGIFNGHISGRHGCANRKKRTEVQEEMEKKFPDLMEGTYNLAWKVLSQPDLNYSNDMREMLMTITGTIIVVEENGEPTYEVLPSQTANPGFLHCCSEGGLVTFYKCDEHKQCLKPVPSELNLSPEAACVGRIKKTIEEIQEKIIRDEELSASEVSFLTTSNLPIYRILVVWTSYKHGRCPIELNDIARIIAMDELLVGMRAYVERVKVASQKLRAKQMFAFEIDAYIKNLDNIVARLKEYELQTFKRMEIVENVVQRLNALEKQVVLEMGF